MRKDMYPILCGGTYFTLILQAARQQSDDCKCSDLDVLVGLIQVIDPSFVKPQGGSFRALTSQYKSCSEKQPKTSENLPFTKPIIRQSFNDRIQNEYKTSLRAMQGFSNSFIDVASSVKAVWLVKALLELIKLDQSIKDTDIFYMKPDGRPVSKSELTGLYDNNLPALNICLSAFLLGIWHFIIVNRQDNNIGKATYDNWHKEAKLSGQKREYVGEIGRNVKRQIDFIDIDKAVGDVDSKSFVFPPNSSKGETISITEDSLIDKGENETPSQLMLKIFKKAIEKYSIVGFMNNDELAPARRVFDFVNEIKSEVLCRFVGSQKEWMYRKIRDFTLKLESYNHILTMVRQPYREIFYLINEREESLNDFEKSVIPFRQVVNSLYSDICDGDTLFVY